jgi:HAD superfamily hydrolase (TIGR01549 family)
MIRCVIFDVGETIRDDTREFAAWADWLDVPRHTFSALYGAMRVQGKSTDDVFQCLAPGFDLEAQRRERAAALCDEMFGEEDLYPDVRPALSTLREVGLWIGIAGNQSRRAQGHLEELRLPVDGIITSAILGTSKPSPAFFFGLMEWSGYPAEEILYVGDHRDNDLRPARECGISTALIRRGPFGHLWADEVERAGEANLVIETLLDLPRLFQGGDTLS